MYPSFKLSWLGRSLRTRNDVLTQKRCVWGFFWFKWPSEQQIGRLTPRRAEWNQRRIVAVNVELVRLQPTDCREPRLCWIFAVSENCWQIFERKQYYGFKNLIWMTLNLTEYVKQCIDLYFYGVFVLIDVFVSLVILLVYMLFVAWNSLQYTVYMQIYHFCSCRMCSPTLHKCDLFFAFFAQCLCGCISWPRANKISQIFSTKEMSLCLFTLFFSSVYFVPELEMDFVFWCVLLMELLLLSSFKVESLFIVLTKLQ